VSKPPKPLAVGYVRVSVGEDDEARAWLVELTKTPRPR